ncbi:MAG TPA: sugar transferase [Gemmatimonadaceae bacterium]|nr:sugar transferase [Gemmatimonadaceae bacterium]
MPERQTPVVLRNAQPNQANERSEAARERGGKQRLHRRVLVIGAPGDLPRALAHPAVVGRRFSVVDSIAVDVEAPESSGTALVETAELIRGGHVDTLLVAGEIGPSAMRRVADLALAYHCDVLAVMPTEVLAEHEPVVVWSGDSPLVQLTKIPRHPVDNAAKRVMDVMCASIGLIVTAPLMVALATLIRLESRGAPFFPHERVGFRGKKFRCLKLRTMRADAEQVLRADPRMYEEYRQNHFKIPDSVDPRVTRIGRFLRRTSLDELPQLWNVLIGEMSLVGPRPVVEEELEMYGDDRDLVLSVKPGLTGAWAVNGRQAVGYPERCDLELRYVRERTLVQDTRIMFRTAAVVLRPLSPLKPGE